MHRQAFSALLAPPRAIDHTLENITPQVGAEATHQLLPTPAGEPDANAVIGILRVVRWPIDDPERAGRWGATVVAGSEARSAAAAVARCT